MHACTYAVVAIVELLEEQLAEREQRERALETALKKAKAQPAPEPAPEPAPVPAPPKQLPAAGRQYVEAAMRGRSAGHTHRSSGPRPLGPPREERRSGGLQRSNYAPDDNSFFEEIGAQQARQRRMPAFYRVGRA